MKTKPADTELSKGQEVILETLRRHPGGLTRYQIHQHSRLRLSTVCGRVNELATRKPPLVEVAGRTRDPETRKYVEVIRRIPANHQPQLSLGF